MSTEPSNALTALRDTPFELLQELERRSKLALAGPAAAKGDAQEWVGIGFRLGTDWLLVARHEVREVMIIPSQAARVPGAKPWVVGLVNVRGQLLPLVDLKQFLGAGTGGGHAAEKTRIPRDQNVQSACRTGRTLSAHCPDNTRLRPIFQQVLDLI